MRLIDMQAEYFDQMGWGEITGSPDKNLIARANRNFNSAYREVLGTKGLQKIRRRLLPFACTANTPYCVLPFVCSRVIDIQDRTNQWLLDDTSLLDLRFTDPALTQTTSFPYKYVIDNLAAAVAQEPSAAAAVFAVSTSALDTGAPTVYLQTILTGNYPRLLNQALTGTVAVNMDATVASIIAINKFYLSAPTKGDVVLTQTSGGGTELARIPAGKTMARYTRLHLYPTPTQINTYYADVELLVEPLVNPNDEPILHEDFHYILVSKALMREFNSPKRPQPTLYANEKARAANGVAEYILFLAKQSGAAWSDRRVRRYSQLGSNFAPGT